MKITKYILPASWASMLVNADESGLSLKEINAVESFTADLPAGSWSVDGEAYPRSRNDANEVAGVVLDFEFVSSTPPAAGEAEHTLNVSRPKPDALAQFLAAPSPAKAVALAIADHRTGKLVDWPFVDELVKAQAMCNSHAALVAALERMERTFSGNVIADTQNGQWALREVRAALEAAK